MKTKTLTLMAFSILLASSLITPASAQQEKSIFEQAGSQAKYTTGDFKPAPEKIQTRFGNPELSRRLSNRRNLEESL